MSNEISRYTGDSFKKHVGLIHAEGRPPLMQRKLFNGLLAHAQREMIAQGEEIESFKISLRVVCSNLGITMNDMALLKRHIDELQNIKLKFNLLGAGKDPKKTWGSIVPLAEAYIQEGSSYIEYSLPPIFRSLVRNPEIYGTLNDTVIGKMSSKHALVLYEHAASVVRKNHPSTDFWTLEQAHIFFGTTDCKSLQRYAIFKNRVLKVAIDVVNRESDIYVALEEKKRGRSVKYIRFNVRAKETIKGTLESGKVTNVTQEEISELITGRAKSFTILDRRGIRFETIVDILRDYTDEEIERTVLITEPTRGTEGIRNFAGIFIKELKKQAKAREARQQVALELEETSSDSIFDRDLAYEGRKQAQSKIESIIAKAEKVFYSKALANLSDEEKTDLEAAFQDEHEGNAIGIAASNNSESTIVIRAKFAISLQKGFVLPFAVEDFQAYIQENKGDPEIDQIPMLLSSLGGIGLKDIMSSKS